MSLDAKIGAGLKKSYSKMTQGPKQNKSVEIQALDNGHHIVTERTGDQYPGKRTGHKDAKSALKHAGMCLGVGVAGPETK